MARYKDADALKNYIGEYAVNNYQTVTPEHLDRMLDIVDSMPDEDVVKIIRCKDCAHFVFWHTRCMCDLAAQNGENPEFYCANAVLSDSGRRKREWDEYNKTYAAIADRRNEPC